VNGFKPEGSGHISGVKSRTAKARESEEQPRGEGTRVALAEAEAPDSSRGVNPLPGGEGRLIPTPGRGRRITAAIAESQVRLHQRALRDRRGSRESDSDARSGNTLSVPRSDDVFPRGGEGADARVAIPSDARQRRNASGARRARTSRRRGLNALHMPERRNKER